MAGAQFELKVALECNGSPRLLSRCEAASSQAWLIDLHNAVPEVIKLSTKFRASFHTILMKCFLVPSPCRKHLLELSK